MKDCLNEGLRGVDITLCVCVCVHLFQVSRKVMGAFHLPQQRPLLSRGISQPQLKS